MQRLGKNLGRYHGEGIDLEMVQRETHRLAEANGWIAETFLDAPSMTLRGYYRLTHGAEKNIYVSTGIHGDEPSGPLTVLRLLEENVWPKANLWLVPCLNPTGFKRNTRENEQGIDLNRDFRHLTTVEIAAHVAWLARLPMFSVALILHEDWEANGFYVYELNPENLPTLAEPIVEAVRPICPIEAAEVVDTFACKEGIIRPEFIPENRPQWAEAIYLVVNKSRQSYTLETPSDFPLEMRVRTHYAAVRRAFELIVSS